VITAAAGPALELRKRCGLPEGRFDAARVSAWGGWAIDELIAGQIAYHRAQAAINGRVMHRVHAAENLSFLALMAVLASYIVAAVAMAAWEHEPPHWLGGVVFMAGSIVPAIGAASLALDATLSLREQAQRSDVLAARLEAVRERLGPQPDLQGTQSAIRAAMRLMRAQEDHWAEASVRRKLYRGG